MNTKPYKLPTQRELSAAAIDLAYALAERTAAAENRANVRSHHECTGSSSEDFVTMMNCPKYLKEPEWCDECKTMLPAYARFRAAVHNLSAAKRRLIKLVNPAVSPIEKRAQKIVEHNFE